MPAATREAAIRCVLDLVGSAAMGLDHPGTRAAREAAARIHGAGASPIWFSGRSASPAGAVFANSTAAAALDVDDGVRIARGHPGAAVIPAAWAALEPDEVDAERLLRGVVAGYEAAVRMALGRLAFSSSGTWSPYGAIAAIGTMRGVAPEVLANAFGIAAQAGPAMKGLAGRMGSDVKEGIPFGAVAGRAALELSLAGFSGPAQIFDEPQLFDAAPIVAGLEQAPIIEQSYFKPYACCRHLHAPIDAYRALERERGFTAREVERIEVHTYQGTFNLSNKPAPTSLIEAQYSVPYCLALCAVRGPDALLPMDEASLNDPQVLALATRIILHQDAQIDRLFPARSPARVTVFLSGGVRHDSPVTDPRGDPATALTTAELEEKLRTGTRHVLAADHRDALIGAIGELRRGRLSALRAALAAPARL
jgi:2-methylcitrate dehydratase PrpD